MNGFFRELEEKKKVLVFGHRGFSQDYPENTMLSFSQCAGNPLIDGVELDVHMCRSGEVVVAHDFSLNRTAGLDCEIEDLTLDELRDIDVGSFKDPKFSDARIPLLTELFSGFGDRFLYDIELKVKAGHVNRMLSRKVIEIISGYGLWSNVLVSSFNPLALRAFGHECRLHHLGAPRTADIFARSKDIPKVLWNGAGHLVSRSSYQKPESKQVDDAYLRSHGRLPVITWTVNTEAEARRLLDLNRPRMKVFGLIGNDPHMLAQAVSHWKD